MAPNKTNDNFYKQRLNKLKNNISVVGFLSALAADIISNKKASLGNSLV